MRLRELQLCRRSETTCQGPASAESNQLHDHHYLNRLLFVEFFILSGVRRQPNGVEGPGVSGGYIRASYLKCEKS